MTTPDILFKGIPRGRTRGYTAEVIQTMRPKVCVIPCCGSFSLAHVACTSGIPNPAIVCGDVSLYSTALGNAITGADWRLDVKPDVPADRLAVVSPLLEAGDPVSKAVAVLFMIRLLQYEKKRQTHYHRGLQRELIFNHLAYCQQIREQITEKRDELHGIQYQARDMWETLEDHRGNEQALILANPPRYDGGYERMFKGLDQAFDWDEPAFAMFKEKDYARLMDDLGASPATTMMYYATPGEDPTPLWGEPWRAVFADRPGNSKLASINWIIANKTVVDHASARPKIYEGKAVYPFFVSDVRPDAKIWAERIEKDVGDYYRDLLIHKLPGSVSEVYVAILLDGHLLAVAGLLLSNFRRGSVGKESEKRHKAPANLIFAFSVPHDSYRRLHKLVLMTVVSEWFWDDIMGEEHHYELRGPPDRVQSTMLTPYPENKTARGVMKMGRRERQKDGTYKLSYYADVLKRTREETVQLWLQKYGTALR